MISKGSFVPALGKLFLTFSILTAASLAQKLQHFDFSRGNGSSPRGGLVVDQLGNFYGSTYYGGSHNDGVIYEINVVGEAVLYDFTGSGSNGDGAGPIGDLVMDQSGNLYGVTQQGGIGGGSCGSAGCGTVFQLSPPSSPNGAWTETVLYAFQGSPNDGAAPVAGLTFDKSGNLYGTTSLGGIESPACPCGTVFELSPPMAGGGAWTENVLYAFTGHPDGSQPLGGVVFDLAGNLYGTTSLGGFGSGTVFQLTPPATQGGPWVESVLHDFRAYDGSLPEAGLTLGANGSFFGTTEEGGAFGQGEVFRLSPPSAGGSWRLGVVHSFHVFDGASPAAGVILDGPNTLFGTTSGGGNPGNIFEITKSGATVSFSILYEFSGGYDGGRPVANLLLRNGALYGTTENGGFNGNGVVFKLSH